MPDEKDKSNSNRDKVVVTKDSNKDTKKDFENLDQALDYVRKDTNGRKIRK